MYYLRARYYDPVTGRFLSKDPILKESISKEISDIGKAHPLAKDIADELVNDIKANHSYAYAKNNPVNLIDPWGLAYLKFNGWYSWLYHDSGKLWKGPVRTITGNPFQLGWTQSGGPLPPGSWVIYKREHLGGWSNSWGRYRLGPLWPLSGTNSFGRGGFYIHGGKMHNPNWSFRFTQGCLKTRNWFVKYLYEWFPKMNGVQLKVEVDYRNHGSYVEKR